MILKKREHVILSNIHLIYFQITNALSCNELVTACDQIALN
jgi:hypothetical protein